MSCKVIATSREVIQEKLLKALNDDSDVVAALLTKDDLDVLIAALLDYKMADWKAPYPSRTLSWEAFEKKRKDFAEDLLNLRKAFE